MTIHPVSAGKEKAVNAEPVLIDREQISAHTDWSRYEWVCDFLQTWWRSSPWHQDHRQRAGHQLESPPGSAGQSGYPACLCPWSRCLLWRRSTSILGLGTWCNNQRSKAQRGAMTECKTRAERNRDRKTKEEKQFLPVSCFANMQSMGEVTSWLVNAGAYFQRTTWMISSTSRCCSDYRSVCLINGDCELLCVTLIPVFSLWQETILK